MLTVDPQCARTHLCIIQADKIRKKGARCEKSGISKPSPDMPPD